MNKGKLSTIKKLLYESGVTQKQIAISLAVSSQAVSQVVLGIRTTPRIQKAIAEAIGKPIDEIFPATKPMEAT